MANTGQNLGPYLPSLAIAGVGAGVIAWSEKIHSKAINSYITEGANLTKAASAAMSNEGLCAGIGVVTQYYLPGGSIYQGFLSHLNFSQSLRKCGYGALALGLAAFAITVVVKHAGASQQAEGSQ